MEPGPTLVPPEDAPAAPASLAAPHEASASAADALSPALARSSDEAADNAAAALATTTTSDASSPRPLNIYDLPPPTPEEAAAEAAAVARTLAAERLGSPEAQAARAAERALAERAYHPIARAPQPELRLREERPRNVNLVCVWPRCATVAIPGGARFKRCSACNAVYCSRSCQTEDWPRHRPECKAHRAAQRAKDYGERALVPFVAEPEAEAEAGSEVEAAAAAPAEAGAEAVPAESPVAAPAAAVSVTAAPPLAAVSLAPAAPAASVAGQRPANIRAEDAAFKLWIEGTVEANLAAAERGDAAAQHAMGDRFYDGNRGVPQDFAQAVRWFRKAADQGFATSQFVLGCAYVSGQGVPLSDADALMWFHLSSSQGVPEAQWSLGRFYELGRCSLDADADETVRLYKLAAASGFPRAIDSLRRLGFSPLGALICRTCFALPPAGTELQRCSGCKEAHYCGATCQRADWGPRHRAECKAHKARQVAQRAAMEAELASMLRWVDRPLAELRRAAASGDSAAQAVLGDCYHDGSKGLAVSMSLAAEWRAKAAASGHSTARTALGWHYNIGQGVLQDRIEGERLYRLAAKQGHSSAMHNLGLCLKKGQGCEAVLWLRRAADLGYASAQGELARWYVRGECSLPQNYKEALRLARLGIAQGDALSMRQLGYLYGQGLGVAKDREEACTWFRRAAALGDEDSKRLLLKLAREGVAPALAAVRELGLGPL